MRNTRLKHNATMMSIRAGILRMSKRINVPMIHPEHIKTASNVFKDLAHDLDKILNNKRSDNSEKCFMAQSSLMLAHARLEKQWKDPRKLYERGELLERNSWDGLTDVRGNRELRKKFEDDDTFTG
jgi:ethanolamine utilization cobalamin adenosyltransferase